MDDRRLFSSGVGQPTNFGADVLRGRVQPSQRINVPKFFADNAKDKGLAEVYFLANASAGNYSGTITLTGYSEAPLSMVWFMGTVDKNFAPIDSGGGLVPGSAFDTGSVLEGMEIFSGAKANYTCQKDKIVIKITSTNVGWSGDIFGLFYYMTFYDETEVARYGL